VVLNSGGDAGWIQLRELVLGFPFRNCPVFSPAPQDLARILCTSDPHKTAHFAGRAPFMKR